MRVPTTALRVALRRPAPDPSGEPPSFVLRRALGPALRRVACTADCGDDDPCGEPHRCAFGRVFEPEGDRPPPVFLDAADLDDDDDAPIVRVAVFDDALRAPIVAATGRALTRGLGPREARVRWDVLGEALADVDVLAEAARLTDGCVVVFATPVDVAGWRAEAPDDLSPLLVSAWQRAKALGLDTSSLPRFDREAPLPATPLESGRVSLRNWSQRSGRAYPVGGLLGAFAAAPDPAQAAWLALGAAIGVGRGASRGLGILRLTPRS